MALQRYEGFDDETTGTKLFDAVSAGASSSTTRDGRGLSWVFSNANSGDWNLSSQQATLIPHGAWLFTSPNGQQLYAGFDVSTQQWGIRVQADGSLVICAGSGSTAITAASGASTSAPGIIASSTWAFIEAKVTTGNSGSWTIRVNGTVVLTGTGDTQATANAYCTKFRFGGVGSGMWLDDAVLLDGSGTAANDFLGDIEILLGTPNAMGYLNQGVGTGDTVNTYNNVDEVPANTTDYNTLQAGQLDAFGHDLSVSGTGTIYFVGVTLDAEKTASGAGTIAGGVRLSGTNSVATGQSITTAWQRVRFPDIAKPGGGTWSASDIASTQLLYQAS